LLHAAGPFTLPLLLLLGGMVLGTIVGVFDGADHSALLNSARRLGYLLVVPLLTSAVIDSRRALRAALAVAAALVAYKSVTGAAGWLLGQGREVDGSVLTYYSPTANFLNLVFLLAVGGALIRRAPIPRVLVWLAPLTFAVLILSFRRNFWIAFVLGALLLVLVASGRRGRQLLIPAAALAAAALFFAYGALSTSQSDSPIVTRVQSLSPTKLESGAYDRYRIDEQRNVRAEIRRSPLVGIGLGVPWTARYPLAVSFGSALRDYSHIVLTWYWLKMGLIGIAAYLLLMGTAVRTGIRLWRESSDDLLRIPGLALGIGFVGLVVAEGTGSYTGVDPRMTVLVAVCLGWLAAATRVLAAPRPPAVRAADE
jgi:O-antigen ligase